MIKISPLIKFINACIPLYFYLSSIFLLIILMICFGWLIKYAKQDGSDELTLGNIASSIADTPNILLDVKEAIMTELGGVSPTIHKSAPIFDIELFRNLHVNGNVQSIDGPIIYSNEKLTKGYRVIVGYYQVGDIMSPAAILLDTNLNLLHVWRMHEQDIDYPHKRDPKFKYPHGFEILPDGSIIYTFDGGVSIKRVSKCDETIWSNTGYYHHAITLDESQKTLWTLRHAVSKKEGAKFHLPGNRLIEQIDVSTGKVTNSISFLDIMEENPDISIFHVKQQSNGLIWGHDPFHENDVQSLPKSLELLFPLFDGGDLVVSVRNINLIFVLNPESKHIKWWRAGNMHRQHDADWLPNGKISIFDNNSMRGNSRIIQIDPLSMEVKTTLDGNEFNFYSENRGKHQVLSDGTIIVTSSNQGRIFEVSPDGEVVFELINISPNNPESILQLSEAIWLPENYFNLKFDEWSCEN